MAKFDSEHVERIPSQSERAHEDRKSARVLTAGSVSEAAGAAGAVVVSILGLTGILPLTMMSVAVICLGAAVLIESCAVASRYSHLIYEIGNHKEQQIRLGGSAGMGALGGIAAIALGILSLLRIAPAALIPSAVIVLGVTAVFSSSIKERLSALDLEGYYGHERAMKAAQSALLGSTGIQSFAGLGAIVLGILALVDINPMILNLSGLLVLGCAFIIASSALGAKMTSMLSD